MNHTFIIVLVENILQNEHEQNGNLLETLDVHFLPDCFQELSESLPHSNSSILKVLARLHLFLLVDVFDKFFKRLDLIPKSMGHCFGLVNLLEKSENLLEFLS